MMNNCFYVVSVLLTISFTNSKAQFSVKVENGQIFVNDSWIRPDEQKLRPFSDSLDRNLKIHPNDTTSLFYRAVLYLQFNKFVINPDLSSNRATIQLLLARKMVEKADSLKMQNFHLKVLRAQICKELTNRYAPAETWRFNAKQMTDRKQKFDYYKNLANTYYDELALIDKKNAYDYQRLKVN